MKIQIASMASFPRTFSILAALSCACAATHEVDHAPRLPRAEPLENAVKTVVVSAETIGAPGVGDELFPTAGNGGYDVQSYDLKIALDDPMGPIDASVVIQARATQALGRFDLDFHELQVRTLDVDGIAATYTRDEDELIVTPKRSIESGAEFTVLVRYSGTPEGILDPSFPIPMKLGWIAKQGEVYVVSQPTGAKTFFPCNDHPRDKALYTLSVTVPKPLTVVGNGQLAETIDRDDKRTFIYRPRDPIATYLVTLAIAAFDEEDVTGPDGLTIRNYFSPKSKAGAREAFARTGEIITFLSETFGAYPFETCGNILASINLPGALETQTLPVYGANAGDESIICHEQAHQWFGDSICVENWKDIWLNEGFAEYAAWMYIEHAEGREKFEKHLRDEYASYRSRSKPKTRPGGDVATTTELTPSEAARTVATPGNPTLKSMFGASVYVRGPLALHALRGDVGDDAFLELMRAWVVAHANGNASVEDFLAHVEKHASKHAREVLERWIFDAEMPRVLKWDEELAQEKAAREARRKEREAGRRERKRAEEDQAPTAKKDG